MGVGSGPEALTWVRQISGLTQRELARRSGVSERTIRAIERGEVARPHLASLRAIADAAELDTMQHRAFLRAWRSGRVTSYDTMLRTAAPVNDLIAETMLQAVADRHVIGSWTRHVVNPDRSYTAHSDVCLEAKRDGLDTYVASTTQDPDGDPRTTQRLTGCHIRKKHHIPEHNVTILEMALPRPLARGETAVLGFTTEVTGLDPEPLEETDYLTVTSQRVVPMLVVDVRFTGTPPPEIWEIEYRGSGRRRVRTLTPFEGRVEIVRRNVRPGTYGIEWYYDHWASRAHRRRPDVSLSTSNEPT